MDRHHVQRQGRNLPVNKTEKLGVTKPEKGGRSNYLNDHFQDMDEKRFGCAKGCGCSDPWQRQALWGSKRNRRSSGSEMQAVFLSRFLPSSHAIKESVGTGVFLPPGTRNATEPKKKSGCSTVLLPAGVIQALKLHFDRMNQQCDCSSPPQRGVHSPSMQRQSTEMGRTTSGGGDFNPGWSQLCGAGTTMIPMSVYLKSGYTDGIKRKQG